MDLTDSCENTDARVCQHCAFFMVCYRHPLMSVRETSHGGVCVLTAVRFVSVVTFENCLFYDEFIYYA